MEYPDSGVDLTGDFTLHGHAVLSDESRALATDESKIRSVWNQQNAELQTFIDVPDPFFQAKSIDAGVAEREHKPEHKQDHKHKEWWEVAGDWVSGAVDVVTQVVVGAAEEVVEAVTERPYETLGMLAGGLAIGVAIGVAAPVATLLGASAAVVGGVTLATDAAIVGLTTFGAVHAGGSVIKAVEESSASADVLMNKSEYSIAEIQSARENIQDKSGAAAIEAGFTLTTAGLAAGNAVRLVNGAGKALKIKPTAAEEGAAATEASVATETAVGTEAAATKGPAVIESAATTDGAAVEGMQAQQRIEPPWRNKSEADASAKLRGLPEDAAPELLRKIDGVIAERQAKFDIDPLRKKFDELEAIPDPEIMVPDSAGGTRPLRKDELYELGDTRELLKGTPEAQVYEEWVKRALAKADLRDVMEPELNLRHMLVSDIINKHAEALFPDGTVPTLEVKSLARKTNAEAGYSRGRLHIRDEYFDKPSYYHEEGIPSKTVNSYTHEITHGEQDGLIIRNLIDHVTGGDTTGRRLTMREIDEIIHLGNDRVKTKFPDELIEDINAKRAGRVLREDEVARAQKLEVSKKANREASQRHAEDEEYFDRLKVVLQKLDDGDVPPDFFSDGYQARLFGKNAAPETFKDLTLIFETLVKPHIASPNAEQLAFAAKFKSLLVSEIRDLKDAAYARKQLNRDEYLGWQHEAEAWRIGTQAGRQVTDVEILSGERLQSQVDAMMRNPIDYTEVLAY